MGLLDIDHIAVAARTLEEGVAYVEAALGARMTGGGKHARMGTHNKLLRLGDDLYLEVIAVDPQSPAPASPRWFALDQPQTWERLQTPTVWTWVVRATSPLDLFLSDRGFTGEVQTISRDALSWQMLLPSDGSMQADGAWPTLMRWPPGVHPLNSLAESGCTWKRLIVMHPRAGELAAALGPMLADGRIQFVHAPQKSLRLVVDTPAGERVL